MVFVRRLFLILCLFLSGLAIWAAIYARKQGFTESWRDVIEAEFAKRDYHVDIGKITLGAFRGLVAEDVRFFSDPERTLEVALVDDIFLDVDLSEIFNRKEISINTLDVQNARIVFPLDKTNPNGQSLAIGGLSGRIVVTESVIEILKAEASLAGIDLAIKGTLLRPARSAEEKPEANEMDLGKLQLKIAQALETLSDYEFFGKRPLVEIDFRGDLNDLATISVEALVKADGLRKRGQDYELHSIEATFQFDGLSQEAKLLHAAMEDKKGRLFITGNWDGADERFHFQTESSVDLPGLIGMFLSDPRLGEAVLFAPAQIKAKGYIDLPAFRGELVGFPGEVTGDFRTERFVTRGVVFDGIDFGFSVAGDRFYVRNLRLDHKSGVAFLNLKYEPHLGAQSIQYQAEVKLDPRVFRPFLDAEGRKFLDTWDFHEESSIYMAANGAGPNWDLNSWKNKGVLDLRQFHLNGVPFLQVEAEVEADGEAQIFRNVRMIREEGMILAEEAKNNLDSKLWDLKGVVSTVDLVEGARAFNPMLAKELKAYRVEAPPTVKINGSVDGRTDEEVGDVSRNNDLQLSFTTRGTTEYDFLGKTVRLNEAEGNVSVRGSRVHLTSMTGGTLGGQLHLDYDSKDVRLAAKPFAATIRLDGIPLEAMTELYGNTSKAKGQVQALFEVTGASSDDPRTLNGTGNIVVSEGNLFALPVLGTLSGVLGQVVADGTNGERAIMRDATATFRIESGVLNTDDVVILATNLQVRAAGSISLVDRSIDFEAVVNPKGGLSRAILTPVSELLMFSGTGTIEQPVWKPKHISNLAKLPTQVLTEITQVPMMGIRMIGKGIFGPDAGAQGPAEGRDPSQREATERDVAAPPKREGGALQNLLPRR